MTEHPRKLTTQERAAAKEVLRKAREINYQLRGYAKAFDENKDYDAATLLRDAADFIEQLTDDK